jgi:periodic tryptophan protein 1
MIHCFDARSNGKKALWKLQAHDEPVTSFAVNPIIPGFIATGSTDKTVKLWNINSSVSETSSGPTMVVSRNMDVGKVFSVGFAPDQEVGFRLAIAGSKGTMRIWDTSTNAAVRRIFGDRVASSGKEAVQDRVVGLEDDEEEEEDDEEEEQDNEDGGVRLQSGSGTEHSEEDSDEMVD